MLQSMTAFGQSLGTTEHGTFRWEIRSVNHRFLDVGLRLPEGLRPMESRLRDIIGSKVSRGKLEVFVKLADASQRGGKLVLDQNLLHQLSDVLDQVQSVRSDADQVDPLKLLQWPGLLSDDAPPDVAVQERALEMFLVAFDDFLQTRLREGSQLAELLLARADQLSLLVAKLRDHRPAVVSRQSEKLINKLEQLSVEHDSGRLEQELVYAAQRLDIDEELDRLDAHLHEFRCVLERTEAVGRRLDFLLQELNREANTVSSKACDSATTAASIDMKVLIEQMREQVQNVE